MEQLSYRRHRFPPPIIQHAIWLYLRFTLSYRDVEELLAERGLGASYETVRRFDISEGCDIFLGAGAADLSHSWRSADFAEAAVLAGSDKAPRRSSCRLRADRFHLPAVAIVAIAIKCDSPGPVFERERRVGSGGRRFDALKFRTTLHAVEDPGLTWRRAPEMTRVGRYLRYTGIDDLPQLFDVLRGEMSIIDSDAGSHSFLD
jgi:hypothetical protein